MYWVGNIQTRKPYILVSAFRGLTLDRRHLTHVEGLSHIIVPDTRDREVHDRRIAEDVLVEELGEVYL